MLHYLITFCKLMLLRRRYDMMTTTDLWIDKDMGRRGRDLFYNYYLRTRVPYITDFPIRPHFIHTLIGSDPEPVDSTSHFRNLFLSHIHISFPVFQVAAIHAIYTSKFCNHSRPPFEIYIQPIETSLIWPSWQYQEKCISSDVTVSVFSLIRPSQM
jgi:hypothetical protein